ncbi:MAG TPA: type II toxin-antitoxin system Phd/YefM family antitoxin [Anaerolineae bacterium]|nr:type II toxin-antitoxin system Phd/YefM family antitoxin [Anaerolineae bacterium]
MNEFQVSIGDVKRDISQLLNRVAYGHERIVLTSRGKPKAVIVSLADYTHIQQTENLAQVAQWEQWVAANRALTTQILAERDGQPVDVDTILQESRADREERHAYLLDH